MSFGAGISEGTGYRSILRSEGAVKGKKTGGASIVVARPGGIKYPKSLRYRVYQCDFD